MPGRRAGSATGSRRTIRRGISPAHTSSAASGPSPSSGGPRRIFTEHSSRVIRRTVVAASSLADGERAYSHCPGATWSLMARRPTSFSLGVGQHLGNAVDHGAAVVDRMFEHRTGQHQTVDMGDRHARLHRLAGGAQAPAGHRSMEEEPVVVACVAGGHHHRPPVDEEAEMADEPGVEHGMEIGTPVRSLFGDAPEAGPVRHRHLPSPPAGIAGWGRFGHGRSLPRTLRQPVPGRRGAGDRP